MRHSELVTKKYKYQKGGPVKPMSRVDESQLEQC